MELTKTQRDILEGYNEMGYKQLEAMLQILRIEAQKEGMIEAMELTNKAFNKLNS
jgi:hypothetical protein